MHVGTTVPLYLEFEFGISRVYLLCAPFGIFLLSVEVDLLISVGPLVGEVLSVEVAPARASVASHYLPNDLASFGWHWCAPLLSL